MKLAVTGGAGFLGYHICKRLSEKFSEIYALDISPFEKKEYPENTKFLSVDVREKRKVLEGLKGIDIIVHSAAALPLWKRKDIFDTNIDGTRNVLEAAVEHGIERVVFISSTAVYGIPKKHPICEEDPLVGVGPYGESKIIAEGICTEFRDRGLCIPIVRPKTFIGIGRLGVFQILYDWVRSGKRIPIIGNGRNRYQLLEVDDLVDSIYLALTLPKERVNDTFNVGAKEFGTVLDDVGAMCSYSNTGSRVLPVSSSIAKPILSILWKLRLSPLYKWIYDTADTDSYVSIEKAEKVLGWFPRYSNREALIRSYSWYLQNLQNLGSPGVTHRVAWRQGVLSFIKKFL
jgi:nucleoside-diphosphate-sugar epimerase